MKSALDYDNILILDGSSLIDKVNNHTKLCLKNILNIVDAVIGNKIDQGQKKILRKVVLDEVNKLKNVFLILYDNDNTD